MSAVLQPFVSLGYWLWALLASIVAAIFGNDIAPYVLYGVKILLLILCIVVPLMLSVAYLTLWERKVIGWIQLRLGRIAWGRWVCCSRSRTASSCW